METEEIIGFLDFKNIYSVNLDLDNKITGIADVEKAAEDLRESWQLGLD